MTSDAIRVELAGPLATILIDRPRRRNAFNLEMWQRLAEIARELSGHDELRVVVIEGVGDHFSAGGDIREMETLLDDDPGPKLGAAMATSEVVAAIPVPTVAVVRGAARGGGLELAVACDLRVADRTATFGLPPGRMGLVYGLPATHRLVATVGLPAARRLLLTAATIDVDEALRIGLVDQVCDANELPAARDELVDRLCRLSPTALRGGKQMLERAAAGQAHDDEHTRGLREQAYVGDDLRAAVRAFVDRVEPTFRSFPG